MAGTHEPVAVLGIGAMGHGMAASALRAGIPTIVWNRRMEATRDLAELGAEIAETAAGAARPAAIVVTMVTDADAVISVARDQGMLAALAPGAIWAQMSTIGVAGIERVASHGSIRGHEQVAMSVEVNYHWLTASRPVGIGMESAPCMAGPVPGGYYPSGLMTAGSPQGAAADSYLVDPAKDGFPPPRLLHLGLINEYERAA